MTDVNQRIAMAKTVIAGFLSLLLRRKVSVNWGRVAAMDENGTIHLPHPKTGGTEEVALLTRLAMHEAGHVVESDLSQVPKDTDKNVYQLFNMLEDPRMEARQMATFKGARLLLNAGVADDLRIIKARLKQSNALNPAELAGLSALLTTALKVAPKQGYLEEAPELLDMAREMLPQYICAAIEKAAEAMEHAACSGDAARIAQQLWTDMQPPQEPEESAQSPEEDESRDSRQASTDAAAGDGAGAGAGETEDDVSEQSALPHGEQDQSQPQGSAEGDAQNPCGEGAADGDSPQGGRTEQREAPAGESEPAGSSVSEDPQSGTSSDVSGDASAQAEALSRGALVPGSSDGGAQAGEPASPTPAKAPDMASLGDLDLGTLLKESYEAQFGPMKIDALPSGDNTESSGSLAQALQLAMAGAEDQGESLDQALDVARVAVLAAMQAAAADPAEQTLTLAVGAGGGKGEAPVVMDFEYGVRLDGVVSKLTRVFLRKMQDVRQRPRALMAGGEEIAVDRFWRLKRMNDVEVFNAPCPARGVSTAVTILLDRSGSTTPIIQEAVKVTLACAQALERIARLKTSIALFPAPRQEPGFATHLKPFGVTARALAKRTNSVNADGGTPLAEALEEILPALLAQPVHRRMVMIISDGEPNDREHAKQVIASAQKQGVEVMGIGLGPEGRKILEILHYSVHVDEVSELPGALEKLFKGRMAEKLAA